MNVNNTGYQVILELSRARMAARPDVYPAAEVPYSHYVMPHNLIGPRRRALIVGSGAGNDVAGALEAGVEQVQAVEIDPAIVDLGRARHPDRPYSSPQVALAVDDARAFFRKDTGPYDLIWFGLLDSHTTPSAYSNVRLDHFVYTRESFADMKRLLAPSGVVVLLFEPQTAVDRRPPGRALPRHLRRGAAGLRGPVFHALPGLGRRDVRRRIAVHDGSATTTGGNAIRVWPAACSTRAA